MGASPHQLIKLLFTQPTLVSLIFDAPRNQHILINIRLQNKPNLSSLPDLFSQTKKTKHWLAGLGASPSSLSCTRRIISHSVSIHRVVLTFATDNTQEPPDTRGLQTEIGHGNWTSSRGDVIARQTTPRRHHHHQGAPRPRPTLPPPILYRILLDTGLQSLKSRTPAALAQHLSLATRAIRPEPLSSRGPWPHRRRPILLTTRCTLKIPSPLLRRVVWQKTSRSLCRRLLYPPTGSIGSIQAQVPSSAQGYPWISKFPNNGIWPTQGFVRPAPSLLRIKGIRTLIWKPSEKPGEAKPNQSAPLRRGRDIPGTLSSLGSC